MAARRRDRALRALRRAKPRTARPARNGPDNRSRARAARPPGRRVGLAVLRPGRPSRDAFGRSTDAANPRAERRELVLDPLVAAVEGRDAIDRRFAGGDETD